MSLDMTSFDAALKVHYGPQQLKSISFRNRPLLALIPKYTRFGGRNLPLPTKYAPAPNRSAGFTQAQRSAAGAPSTGSSALAEFVLTRVKNYGLAFLDGETIKASEGDINAFTRAVSFEIDSCIESISDDLHQDLYTDSSGSRGSISAYSAGPPVTFTLTNAEDATKLEVGMAVQMATAAATGALRDSGQARTITAINRSTGVVTLDGAITGTLANDHVIGYGDQTLKISGLDSWCPSAAPSSTAFFGVDRTADTTKLGGVREAFDTSIRKTLTNLSIEMRRYGAMPKLAFMNPSDVGNLLAELDTKVSYDVVADPDGVIGFDAISVHTPAGVVKVVSDHQCPVDTTFMIDPAAVKLYSLGEAPMLLSLDGNRMLREATSDSYEVRVGYYAQVGSNAPAHIGRAPLS